MRIARPELRPDPALSREAMEALQRDIAAAAVFADDLPFDPAAVRVDGPVEVDPEPGAGGGTRQTTLGGGEMSVDGDGSVDGEVNGDGDVGVDSEGKVDGDEHVDAPVVVGVDQAFLDDRAVSAVVAIRGGEVVERAHAVTALEIPYVPGLLAFREGEPILAALDALEVKPDLLVVDGSGRIHFRQAGIATHVGVLVDVPAVGVAKNLLCGEPERSLDEKLPRGARVPILADGRVDAPAGTVIGHAFQSRQYDSPDRYVNPLYVSPGHRVGVDTATDLVEALCAGYKLPEPTRLADGYADVVKREARGQ